MISSAHLRATFVFVAAAAIACAPHSARAQAPLILADNMAVLHAAKPDSTYRFLGSNAPGQLFFPGEPVKAKLAFTKGTDSGTVHDFSIEIQEISTRDPDAKAKGGKTDTSGDAPLIGLEGKPLNVPLEVAFTEAPETQLEVTLPLPARFGTYALVLVRRGGAGVEPARRFLATVARVPAPRPGATVDNVPIFGEGQMIDNAHAEARAQQYFRMGVRGWRSELGWTEKPDGTTDWAATDRIMDAAEKSGMKIMVTLGAPQERLRPFGDPIPAVGWTPESHGYGGKGDWMMTPENYPRYGKWIESFANRYWKNGKGGLWGFENYNEPWEGGGISGWARDAVQYRALQKVIATSAKKVDKGIKVLAASSIMNTEDKLYSDGTNAMDDSIDIFTDHYVTPAVCYGPMVAAAHGKESMETETWFVNSEYLLPQGVTQFLAAGQKRIAPWHPRVLFDKLPGTADNYFIPTPVVAATAAFNSFVTGKRFEKMLFPDHLPFAFQFGKDSDTDALVVLFGKLMPIGDPSYRDQLWEQVNGSSGGTMTIDNRDGALQFFDLAGNPQYLGQKSVSLPLSIFPTYIKSRRGPAAIAAKLRAAKLEGKRPVEILPRDFSTRPGTAGTLQVAVHNCLNRAITGSLQVTAPARLALQGPAAQPVTLGAGETKTLSFAFAPNRAAEPGPNTFPFDFTFTSDAGTAAYTEVMTAAVAVRGTKTIDGDLADWADVPAVTAVGVKNTVDSSELLRRPWLEVSQNNPEATAGELKMAWDEKYLYIAATVHDSSAEKWPYRFSTRDENSYFHSKASDNEEPYKTFIERKRTELKNPNLSFADFPYIYRRSPEAGVPFRRDRLQIAFDVTPGWHDMKPVTNVPLGFHAFPDTDYEYSVYFVDDGQNGNSEVWRHLAPGVPRIHDFPHQVRSARTTGDVAGAKSVVRRDANGYVYEAAIPRSELADLKLQSGTQFGFSFEFGNSGGPQALYGESKAVTKNNGLTLHPYWERKPSAGVRWTLID